MPRTLLTNNKVLYILLVFHLNQTANSYKIIDLNNLPETKLIQDFKNKVGLLDNVANIKKYNGIIDDIGDENERIVLKKEDEDDNNFKHKVLVKRIVPHGIAPSGVEYDHKFNTAYQPIIRVHKTKSIDQFFNEVESNKYDDTLNKHSDHETIIFVQPRDAKYKHFNLNKDVLLEPFEPAKNNFADQGKRLELLKKIQNKIKSIESESKRLKAYAMVIKVLNNFLRSPQFEKSGEDNDPLAPGKGTKPEQYYEETKSPKKWIPHYPPWNYWTYKKTIHEDICPGTQVKVGNMCVWTPPH